MNLSYLNSTLQQDYFVFNNWSYWPAIKRELEQEKWQQTRNKYLLKKSIKETSILEIFRNFSSLFGLIRCNTLYHTSSSGLFEDGSNIIDLYTEGRISIEEHTFVLVYSVSNSTLSRKLLLQKNGAITNVSIDIIRYVVQNIVKLFKIYNGRLKAIINELQRLGLSPDEKIVRNIVYRNLAEYYVYKKMTKRVRKAYIISSYTKPGICAALLENKAELIEIQHGFIGRSHPGYNTPSIIKQQPLPQKIVVDNEFYKNELLYIGNYDGNSILIKESYKKRRARRAKCHIASSKKTLLFTGQGISGQEVHQFLNMLLKNNRSWLSVMYRPHPAIGRLYIESFGDCLFDINDDNTVLTEELIANADYHMSIYSTCHFDAVDLLGETLVYECNYDIMNDYIQDYPDKFIRVTGITDFYEFCNKKGFLK